MKRLMIGTCVLFCSTLLVSGCSEDEGVESSSASSAPQATVETTGTPEQSSVEQPSQSDADMPAESMEQAAAPMAGETTASRAQGDDVDGTETQGTAMETAEATVDKVEAAAAGEGKKIYASLCFTCHDSGLAGAPKLGDVATWEPRIAQGIDVLYQSSIQGKGAMPAKGGNPGFTDAQVKAAVDYMVEQVQ